METFLIGVQATDERLPDFYDPLASRLKGRGALYVPHVVIPPNTRIAVERPPKVVIGLSSADDLSEVEAWAAEYLASDTGAEVRFERAGRHIVLRAGDAVASRVSLRSLVSE